MTARMGVGLAALGRPGYVNLGHAADIPAGHDVDAMAEATGLVLDEAVALGITWFDAARSYGRAEEFLARWLTGRAPDAPPVTVSSKWGYTYTAAWRVDADVHEVKDHSLATLDRQWAETRALLPDVALYQVHSATLDSGILDDAAVHDRLAELRDGLLGNRPVAIGITTSGPDQGEVIRRALAIERGGTPLFSWFQSTWNLHEQSAGAALAEAHDAGRRVIVKEGVANGRLTVRGDAPADLVPRLLGPDVGHEATPDAVALAAALAQPFATVVLSGAATVDQLRSNAMARALTDRIDLDALPSFAEPVDAYWSRRRALPWT